MPHPVNRDEQSLRRSLKRLLRSKPQPSMEYCANCGSVCEHLPAQFWLYGEDEAFSIGLPFCPHCNPELFSRVPPVVQ